MNKEKRRYFALLHYKTRKLGAIKIISYFGPASLPIVGLQCFHIEATLKKPSQFPMSNVWFKQDEENLELYHMLNIAVKISDILKFSLSWKPIPCFWIISVWRVLLFPWKYLLVKEKELFCWRELSKFLHTASLENPRKVDVSDFQVKN